MLRKIAIILMTFFFCLAVTPFSLTIGILCALIEGIKPTFQIWGLFRDAIFRQGGPYPPCI